MRRVILLAWLLILMHVCVACPAEPTAAAKFSDLLRAEWEWMLREQPTLASMTGFRQHNTAWPDCSLEALKRRYSHRQQVLDQLKTIDRGALAEADRLNYDLFQRLYQSEVQGYEHHWDLWPVNQFAWGSIQDQNPLISLLRFDSVKDYEDWLARMHNLPAYVDQTIVLMREGMRLGLVLPTAVMKRVPPQIAHQLVDDPAKSQFFLPFRKFPQNIAAADRERLSRQAQEAIGQKVVPAYRKLLAFVEKEYLPACPEKVGVRHWPGGDKLYAFLVRYHTTTSLTPEEIHQIGLGEVQRIRREMEALIRQIGFQGSFADFLADLNRNEKHRFRSGDEVVEACRKTCAKIDPQLKRLFGRLPRHPYVIEAVPGSAAPDAPVGYYIPPTADGSKPGTFYVNVGRTTSTARYGIEELCLHEAVPGHHLQLALEMELEHLPRFRRYSTASNGFINAFAEGWALYCEGLGDELGLYRDPYARFGRLTADMLRAVRLVVDTGMHAKGWTRDQAIDFAVANCGESREVLVNEIDRYIAWPGQALSYKIGELKIRELRQQASRELGDRFDVRAFHDLVLGNGQIPLDVLEANVRAWIQARKPVEK
jgi:prolyl oligopeptidase